MERRSLAVFWIHKYYGTSYTDMDLIKLLYTCFGISFGCYNKQRICRISFCRLSEVFLAWTCASSMGNLCSNCFGGNNLSPFPWVYLPLTGYIGEVDNLSMRFQSRNIRGGIICHLWIENDEKYQILQ